MERITRTANEFVKFGTFVAFDDEYCWHDPTLEKGGIACRPGQADLSAKGFDVGERVVIQTDGEILADIDGPMWITLEHGRIK